MSSPGLAMDLDEAEWRKLHDELSRELGGEVDGSQGIEMVERALLSTPARSIEKRRGFDLQRLERYLEGEPRKGDSLLHSCELEVRFGLPRRQLLRMARRADKNKDGGLDMKEWMEMLRDEKKRTMHSAQLSKPLQLVAVGAHYSCCPPTLVILILSALQVGFYVYHSYLLSSFQLDSVAPHCSFLIYKPERREEVWRFFTYQFVHVGLEHIAFNILMQLVVGLPLEMAEPGWKGTGRVLFVYTSGVLLGSLGGTLPNPHFMLAGASAGVYALIAAHLATLLLNWKEDGHIYESRKKKGKEVSVSLAPLVRWIRLISVLAFTLFDISYAIYNHLTEVTISTGYMGHFCGALAGLLAGIAVLDNRVVETWETWVRRSCLGIFFSLVLLATCWHVVGSFTGFFPEPERAVCQYTSAINSDQSHL